MRRDLAFALCILVIAAGLVLALNPSARQYVWAKMGGRTTSEWKPTSAEVMEVLEAMSDSLHKEGFPIVDGNTSLIGAEVGPGLTFRYISSLPVNSVADFDKTYFDGPHTAKIRNDFCNKDGLRFLRENDVTIVHSYVGNDNIRLGEISVNAKDCH